MSSKETINKFAGEFHFLSNFHPSYILYDGIVWRNAEAPYQAMKTEDINQRLNIAEFEKPGEAKKYGRLLTLREDWDDIKLEIMEDVVRCKFGQNALLREMLLATENLELIEGNTWGDKYWGVCDGEGENHLGKILMKVRDEFRDSQTLTKDCNNG